MIFLQATNPLIPDVQRDHEENSSGQLENGKVRIMQRKCDSEDNGKYEYRAFNSSLFKYYVLERLFQ